MGENVLQESQEDARQRIVLLVSVLIFVFIYVWGIAMGIKALSEQSSSG